MRTNSGKPVKQAGPAFRTSPPCSSRRRQGKKNPGCARGIYITAGAILVLLSAGGYSNGDTVMASIILGLGIWFLVLGSRKNK